jgi:hypothetical protein
MPGQLYRFLADDHARLDALLQRTIASPDNIDRAAYAEFRAGLLKHISMEEKMLLPAAQRARGDESPNPNSLRCLCTNPPPKAGDENISTLTA